MSFLLKNPLASLFGLLLALFTMGWIFTAVELHFARADLLRARDEAAAAASGNAAFAAMTAQQNKAVDALARDEAVRHAANGQAARKLQADAARLLRNAAREGDVPDKRGSGTPATASQACADADRLIAAYLTNGPHPTNEPRLANEKRGTP